VAFLEYSLIQDDVFHLPRTCPGNIITLTNKVYDLFLLKCIIVRVIVFVGEHKSLTNINLILCSAST